MTDCEILRLAWFRQSGSAYLDFLRFLEASGGFARARWGGHIVRTLALALLADDDQAPSGEGGGSRRRPSVRWIATLVTGPSPHELHDTGREGCRCPARRFLIDSG